MKENKNKNIKSSKLINGTENDENCIVEDTHKTEKKVRIDKTSKKSKKKLDLQEKMIIDDEIEAENKEDDDEITDKQTIFINNIPPDILDDELHSFILKQDKKIKLLECRIVKDKAGKSRGFAFIDLNNIENAKKCVEAINKKEINGYEIACAISKPPSAG